MNGIRCAQCREIAAQSVIGQFGKSLQGGFERILDAHQVQLVALDIEARLRDLGSAGQCLANQILNRTGLIGGWYRGYLI